MHAVTISTIRISARMNRMSLSNQRQDAPDTARQRDHEDGGTHPHRTDAIGTADQK